MTENSEPASSPDEALPVAAPRRSSRRGLFFGVAIVVIALLAVGGVRANAAWGRHAMVETGVKAAIALVGGNARALTAVSNPAVASDLTSATAAAMRAKGVQGDYSAPAWADDTAKVTVTTEMGTGEILVAPATDSADVVVFRTTGTIGLAAAALRMQRTWTGWVVSGLAVAPMPSAASATATPAP